MTPTVGRIIHVSSYGLDCRAAIITGDIIHHGSYPYTSDDWQFSATVFASHGPIGEAARRIIVYPMTSWHELSDCPG